MQSKPDVLLEQLRLLVGTHSACEPPSGKVDGGKESPWTMVGHPSPSSQPLQTEAGPASPVQVPKLLPPPSSPSPQSKSVSKDEPVSNSKSSSSVLVPVSPPGNPLLFGITDPAEARLLRLRLVGAPETLRTKHLFSRFVVPDASFASYGPLAPFSTILNECNVGSNYDDRIGSTIRCHHLALKLYFNLQPTIKSTGNLSNFRIGIAVLKDKVPTTPGTAPTLYEKGENPPDGLGAVLNCLGLDPATDPFMDAVAVTPPQNAPLYDLLHFETFQAFDPYAILTDLASNGRGAFGPTTHHRVINIPLHFVTLFASSSTTDPMYNSIVFYLWHNLPPSTYAVNGCSVATTVSANITFEDVNTE